MGDADNFCTSCGKRLPRPSSPPAGGEDGPAPAPAAPAGRPTAAGAPQPRPVPAAGPGRPERRPAAAREQGPARRDDDGPLFPPPRTFGGTAGEAPAPGSAPRAAAGKPARSWGSPLTAVLAALACALAVAAAALGAFAPLVEVPFLAGTSTAQDDAVQAVLSVLDPGLSVVAGSLLGTGALGALDLASLGVSLADALADGRVALATGLCAGVAAVGAALCLAGAVSSLVCRRATPALVWGTLVAALAGGGGLAGVLYLNQRVGYWLLHDMSAPFREMGVSIIPASVQVVVPTPWLIALVACALAGLVCAAWARRRWRRGRRVRP